MFQSFRTKIKFSSSYFYFLSANHNPEIRCVICTGVTRFAMVLHFLHCRFTLTALLTANKNLVIFHVQLMLMLKFEFGIEREE